MTAGPAFAGASTVDRATMRRFWLAWSHLLAERYPWPELAFSGCYVLVGALTTGRWLQWLVWGVVLTAPGLWTWRPGGRGRQRLAARRLGFVAHPTHEARSRAGRVVVATVAAWLALTVGVAGFLAVEWAGTETACPTPDGWDYASARWDWSPPGVHCDAIADIDGRIHGPSSPSSWRWLLYAVPVAGLGAVAVADRHRRRVDGPGPPKAAIPIVRGEERVLAFYAHARRRTSSAVEFGYPWLEGAHSAWRLRWIVDTGELVGFRCTWPVSSSPLRWAGERVGAPEVTGVGVLLVTSDVGRVRRLLDGYEEHVRTPAGWEWVRARVGGTQPT